MLSELGVPCLAVRTPDALAKSDALIIPGGESTTMSVLLRTSGLDERVGERLAEGMPALGTCAGMVLLAREVLDGRPDQQCFSAIDISVRRNAFGRQRDSFEVDLDVAGLEEAGLDGSGLHAVFIRAPVVEKTGSSVEVLASVGPGDDAKPVVCRQGPVIVTAFHPELVGETRIHQLFVHATADYR